MRRSNRLEEIGRKKLAGGNWLEETSRKKLTNEREEANYNSILYEQNLKDEIDYYGEDLPHINFYLKFQRKNFLQEFLQEVMLPLSGVRSDGGEAGQSKEAAVPVEEGKEAAVPVEEGKETAVPVEEGKETAVPVEEGKETAVPVEEGKETVTPGEGRARDNATAGGAELEELLNEGGFYVEEGSGGEEPLLERPLLERPPQGKLTTEQHLSEDSNLRDALLKLMQGSAAMRGSTDLTHLNESDEAVKKINEIFQKNKDKFMFSVERQLGTNGEELILQEYCYLCNKKKKLNKPLCAINIYVCYDCKVLDSNFKMISLSKLVRKYCLNHYDLSKYEKQLALLCTKNPRGYSKQMKLYFLFQIKEIAIRKHGSMERVKQMYTSKVLKSFRNAQGTPQSTKKRKEDLHKMVKPKSIYSKKVKKAEEQKIICDNNQHEFDSPICTNMEDSLYVKRCRKCAYQLEYMQF
ncbi:DNA repair protein [Plasmodium cynomolgi strain B]|uniref:DNA repair protein n=1 Tax=Plasmodium cynomolgi (strain B) TaxID=1120755 RepID=K6UHV3_PLACD|nr:DNA repair protein [Plasmodium cynomolgi strain B]GAB64443.1 DNA repair protein [Plasmodium cynomolgi strain B]